MKILNILFCGDLIINSNLEYRFDNELLKLFNGSDHAVANLEGPIIKTPSISSKIQKAGSHLHQNSKYLFKYLTLLNIKYLGAANNHIYDYGTKGQKNTLIQLKNNKIYFNGFGKDLIEASKQVQIENTKIVYLSVCEEEFGIAGLERAGAYSMYDSNLLKQIKLLSKKYSVIIFSHGGCENIPFTSKYIQKRYREFVESGAKLVIGHHPHVVQGYEKYNKGYIFYSLGNFLNNLSTSYKGLILKVQWKNQKISKIQPIHIKVNNCLVKIDHTSRAKKLFSKISKIQNNKILFDKYHQAQSLYLYYDHYMKYFSGHFTNDDKNRKIKSNLLLLHLIRNNSHKEFIETAFKLNTGEEKNIINNFIKTTYNYLLDSIL